MDKFEDFGKRVDEELKRVKSFVKEDVAPETEETRGAIFARSFRKAHRGGGVDRSAECRALGSTSERRAIMIWADS